MNGKQGGDPAKLADALVQLAASTSRRCASPPAPTPSSTFEPKAQALLAQADAHRELSSSLAHDDA